MFRKTEAKPDGKIANKGRADSAFDATGISRRDNGKGCNWLAGSPLRPGAVVPGSTRYLSTHNSYREQLHRLKAARENLLFLREFQRDGFCLMLHLPQRQTLIAQTVEALREGISKGVWKGNLPGEREVCSFLQVSRPTLRAALEILQRENLIKVRQGKRSLILQKKKRVRASGAAVALISPVPLHAMSRNRIFLIDYLHRVLQQRNLHLEIISHPGFGTNQPARALRHLQEKGPFQAFVLTLSSKAVQRWFLDHSLPAIALGSVFPGLSLPSVDTDYPAIGHHAAGILLGNGHRRFLILLPETNNAGDLESEDAFLQTIHASSHEGIQCATIRHGGSGTDLVRLLQPVFSTGQPPTGFFVMRAQPAVTLVSTLLGRGIRIPQDASVISRDFDPMLEWMRPGIAHYELPLRRIATRISRLVVEMATTGPLPLRHVHIMADFQKADSVGSFQDPAESAPASISAAAQQPGSS